MPSILLKSTGKSKVSGIFGCNQLVDPVDDFIAMKRAELGLMPEKSESRKQKSKMGLNEFLRRFTSEDNASF